MAPHFIHFVDLMNTSLTCSQKPGRLSPGSKSNYAKAKALCSAEASASCCVPSVLLGGWSTQKTVLSTKTTSFKVRQSSQTRSLSKVIDIFTDSMIHCLAQGIFFTARPTKKQQLRLGVLSSSNRDRKVFHVRISPLLHPSK